MIKRALVVDDEQSVRGIVAQVLTEERYRVAEATSGEEALTIFKKEPYPIVITDIRMGGMSGLELLKQIKKLSPQTNVIIMTSHGTMDAAVTAIKAGAYDFLHKPFDDLELVASAARRAMQSHALIQEREKLVQMLKSRNEALQNINKAFRALTVTLKNKNAALENLNKAFQALAIRDQLTGLFNRRYFDEAIAAEVARASRYSRDLSIIFLDVDFFKKYNDQYGHQHGDMVLKKISQIVKENIRQIDIATRYGGEEFVVILPETPKADAYTVAEKIRQVVEETAASAVGSRNATAITVSAGVASLGQDSMNAHQLIAKADQAVYEAKRTGRNAVRLAG
ncbi:MAG: diguanylate cyclase [Acidiferrobacterales bacterium]